MSTTVTAATPARTHARASELLRRPFAPGAIGFRAMSKTALGGDLYGGAQVAAYLGEILAHGEPETGIGQGESAELPAQASEAPAAEAPPTNGGETAANGNGSGELMAVDFGGLGPAGPDAA